MVLELLQHKGNVRVGEAAVIGVRRCIVYSVSYSIAVHQGQFIEARVRDDIAVGRATCSPGVTLDVVHRKVPGGGAAAFRTKFKGVVALFEQVFKVAVV